jgi:hypothetical protein
MHMINITDSAAFARAMDSPLDPELRRLLLMRRDQLLADTGGDYDLGDVAHLIVVEPGDTVAQVEATAGWPVVNSPVFEWVIRHAGYILEAPVICDDSGFGIVIFLPEVPGIDGTLLKLLRDQL